MAKSNADSSNLKFKTSGRNSPSRTSKRTTQQIKQDTAEKQTADIPLKDFLDFLRTAYQVNQAIEGVPHSLNHSVVVNWKELTCNNSFTQLFISHENYDILNSKKDEDFQKTSTESSQEVEKILKLKLNEVLNEGLLDSMIPYMLPKSSSQPIIKKPLASTETFKSQPDKATKLVKEAQPINICKEKYAARRKSSTTIDNTKHQKGEVEVEIHVCDEVRNLKKKFKCPQKLLVSKMGYFAEVTSGQKLEDMDISVHCDLNIFEWLMKWVRKDSLPEENWPQLDAGNVVSILVSASFLQMHPLENDCLTFLHDNSNEILKTSSNLSCLNDNILTKLSKLFSNSDVENLIDKKDKIQSRLYCKLITSLVDSKPDPSKGHFFKISSLFRCSKCDQLIMKEAQNKIPCLPQNMKMDRMGNVHFSHSRDPLWDLNDHIRSLRAEFESWRLVYWHLWGESHILNCTLCHFPFPLTQTPFCAHHLETPLFLSVGGRAPRGITLPVGHYPCCGARAFRYEPLPSRFGCHYSDHQPELLSKRDMNIWQIFSKHRSLVLGEHQTSSSPMERNLRTQSRKDQTARQEIEITGPARIIMDQNQPWWVGLHLAPHRPAHGLLTSIWDLYRHADQQTQPGSQEGKISGAVSRIMQQKRQVSVEENSSPTPLSSSSTGDSNSASSSEESSEGEGDWEGGGCTGEGTEDDCLAREWSERENKVANKRQQCAPSVGRWISATTGAIRKTLPSNMSTSSLPFHPRKARWMTKFSTRTNQDNQREREEKAMSWAVDILTRRTASGNPLQHKQRTIPLGGIYVKLEQEWREANGLNVQQPKTLHFTNRQRARIGR
ncbi:hypothetical protein J437_LFUL008660 [Ladona fulva]|uniref:SANT and BTB domain-containing protein n=1 Tax=Ladona fulva TaxID=123851 RepID=A0A8K0K3Y7_LADFU|nr:hypothetical protein J437_LFUL008660 [Ladona fulva]